MNEYYTLNLNDHIKFLTKRVTKLPNTTRDRGDILMILEFGYRAKNARDKRISIADATEFLRNQDLKNMLKAA